MNEQPSYEALMKLIDDIEIMRPPERDIFFHTASAWEWELTMHPERFRIENDELLWFGARVGIIASKQKTKKFWCTVNRLVSDGVIFKYD